VSNFVEVAKSEEVPAGKMKGVTVEGKEILVVNYEGRYYAIGGKCTHAGGDLSKGRLEGKIVTCPRHGSKFDVTTGISVAGPKVGFVRGRTGNESVFDVQVEGSSIKVSV
jgi:3-phenylpropionate/trans-cinnamate dioxygenase ferredoxin subunit